MVNTAIQVWAKRRFKTPLKYLRAKYKREFELNEKIISNTLWARLEPNGRLVVGAVAKKQPAQATTTSTGTEAVASTAAGGNEVNNRDDSVASAAGAAVIHDVTTTSLSPETSPPQYPDILSTCPDAVDNGCHASAD